MALASENNVYTELPNKYQTAACGRSLATTEATGDVGGSVGGLVRPAADGSAENHHHEAAAAAAPQLSPCGKD